jgi:high-affinity nickel-transport protein
MGCYQTLRPFIVGILHGLAGSAAIALLVLATIRNPRWAMAYLLVFGGGTILGMILITAAIAAPFTYVNRLSRKTNSGFQFASGVISLGFGLFLAYHIVFVSGLFAGHPQWTPH